MNRLQGTLQCMWGCESNLKTIVFFQLGPGLLVLIINNIIIINISSSFITGNRNKAAQRHNILVS